MSVTRAGRRGVVAAGAAMVLAGCGITIPTDPDGTLDGIRGSGVLRVGASPSDGWVDVRTDGPPSGREPDLVMAYADHLGAEVEWTVAGEEDLVSKLEAHRIDLAIGGFTDTNAWAADVGLTRPYTGTHVVMVPMGENALQSDLERWLDHYGSSS